MQTWSGTWRQPPALPVFVALLPSHFAVGSQPLPAVIRWTCQKPKSDRRNWRRSRRVFRRNAEREASRETSTSFTSKPLASRYIIIFSYFPLSLFFFFPPISFLSFRLFFSFFLLSRLLSFSSFPSSLLCRLPSVPFTQQLRMVGSEGGGRGSIRSDGFSSIESNLADSPTCHNLAEPSPFLPLSLTLSLFLLSLSSLPSFRSRLHSTVRARLSAVRPSPFPYSIW